MVCAWDAMAIAPGIKGILLAAFLAVCSALAVATGLTRLSPRHVVAPEAWAALERHDADEAASLFRLELQQRPRDPMLHFGAASAARALGQSSSALSSLKKAVELDPEFVEALTLLGQVAYEGGNGDLAIRSLEKASTLRPRDRRLAELLARWQRESSVHNSYLEKPAGHFRILYEGSAQQAIGDRVASVLESGYTSIGRTLNSYPSETVTVILYTNREFQDITDRPHGRPADMTAGFASPSAVRSGRAISIASSRTSSCTRLSPAPHHDACPRGSTKGSPPIWSRTIAPGWPG